MTQQGINKERGVEKFETIYNFMCDWEPEKDVIGIKYAPLAVSTAIASSSGYMNHFFRKAVKLQGRGFISSFLPNVLIPSMAGAFLHVIFVIKPILTTERQCPVCMEVRSGLFSALFGFVYPCLLIPVNVFMGANRYLTYYIPSIHREPLECLKTARTLLFKPHLPRILTLGALQVYAEKVRLPGIRYHDFGESYLVNNLNCNETCYQFLLGMSLAHLQMSNVRTVFEKIAFMDAANKENREIKKRRQEQEL